MCLFKNPDQRGDLIAAVSIKYPSPLNEAQKRLVRQAFAMGGGGGVSPRVSGNFF